MTNTMHEPAPVPEDQSESSSLFLVCHAPLASSLHAVACHAFGRRLSDLEVIDVMASQTGEVVADQLNAAWIDRGRPGRVLVMTDLLGATPANGVQLWLARGVCEAAAVCGVNLPMLLRAINHRPDAPQALADRLLLGLKDCGSILEH